MHKMINMLKPRITEKFTYLDMVLISCKYLLVEFLKSSLCLFISIVPLIELFRRCFFVCLKSCSIFKKKTKIPKAKRNTKEHNIVPL